MKQAQRWWRWHIVDGNLLPKVYTRFHKKITQDRMAFSFGFSGDDVDDEMNDGGVQEQQTSQANGAVQADEQFVGLPAREHLLDDLVGWRFFFFFFAFSFSPVEMFCWLLHC